MLNLLPAEHSAHSSHQIAVTVFVVKYYRETIDTDQEVAIGDDKCVKHVIGVIFLILPSRQIMYITRPWKKKQKKIIKMYSAGLE